MYKAYQYWLANVTNLGNKKLKALIDYFGSAFHVHQARENDFKYVKEMQNTDIKILLAHRQEWDVTKEYKNLIEKEITFVTLEDTGYPAKLRNISNQPYALYVKGKLPDETIPSIAIVGSRICSEYGRKMAVEYSRIFSENKIQIISGLARGVDGISQKSAVEAGGNTFAVLGNGVDICYPKENVGLYEQIPNHGGIISQFPLGSEPRPWNFPIRNEVISGLADIVLVIEAKEKSGSLITADLALDQGKDVFAIPGRLTDPLSSGCNRLIKQGAGIALTPEDVMTEIGIYSKLNINVREKYDNSLASTENLLYSCLDLYPKGLDTIVKEITLPIEKIIHTLIVLEIKGYIREVSKNYYIKIKT